MRSDIEHIDSVIMYPRNYQAQIHGDAAWLKWKIPPVVTAVIYDKGEEQLFAQLTYR